MPTLYWIRRPHLSAPIQSKLQFASLACLPFCYACQVDLYASEAALLGALGAAVAAADPDILLGFEVQRSSLGYAAERAAALGLPSLLRALSRLPRVSRRMVWAAGRVQYRSLLVYQTPFGANPISAISATCQHNRLTCMQIEGQKEDVSAGDNVGDEFAWQTSSGLHCSGRIVLNVWRLMRAGGCSRWQGRAGLGLSSCSQGRRAGLGASRCLSQLSACLRCGCLPACLPTLPPNSPGCHPAHLPAHRAEADQLQL